MDPDGSTPPLARNRELARAHPRAPRGAAAPAFEFQWPADGNSTARARARAKTRNGIRIHNRSIGRSVDRARANQNAHRPAAAAPQKKTRPMMDVELIDEKEKLLKNSKKKRAAAVAVALSVTTRVCRATAIPSIHPSIPNCQPRIGRSKTPARARRPHPRVVRQGRRTPAK